MGETSHTATMKYMVAVDGSSESDAAFWSCIKQVNKRKDFVWVIHVVPFPTLYADTSGLLPPPIPDTYRRLTKRAKLLLTSFGRICHEKMIPYQTELLTSDNIGEAVCKACNENRVDCLFLGKKKRSSKKLTQRFQTRVSVSQYCIEHADCNVTLVKGFFQVDEIRVSTNTVIMMEEIERLQRIKENQIHEEHSTTSYVVAEEELERRRRMMEGLTCQENIMARYFQDLELKGEFIPKDVKKMLDNGKISEKTREILKPPAKKYSFDLPRKEQEAQHHWWNEFISTSDRH